jgi:hypothetical protein
LIEKILDPEDFEDEDFPQVQRDKFSGILREMYIVTTI